MNLAELYQSTPLLRHKDIKVVGDRVFVKGSDGATDEYLIVTEGGGEELWLVRSDREGRQTLEAIKTKLGIS